MSLSVSAIALRWSLMLGVFAALLFLPAGRLDLPFFWAHLALHTLMLFWVLRTLDADLLRERHRPAPGGRDRALRVIALPLLAGVLIIAGWDARTADASDPPAALRIAALIGVAAGVAFAIRAMQANRFFSPVVRIQEERGHTLVTTGPYRFVRHPGYAGAIASWLCTPIALGSWWSLLPLLPMLALVMRRIRIEDPYLLENLPGYADYARKVRWRLLPGVW